MAHIKCHSYWSGEETWVIPAHVLRLEPYYDPKWPDYQELGTLVVNVSFRRGDTESVQYIRERIEEILLLLIENGAVLVRY